MGIHMMRTIDLRGQQLSTRDLLALIPRAGMDVAVTMDAARALIDEVRTGGAAALVAQAERFDRVRPPQLPVPHEQILEAGAALAPRGRAALESTITRVRRASAAQVPAPRVTELAPGAVVEQRWHPVARVGLYVPGGKAVYPSSVVMNVVPAQIAGGESIVLASPPQAAHGGRGSPARAAAARRSSGWGKGGGSPVGAGGPGAGSGLRRCTPWAARARLARSRTGCLRLTWSPCSGWLVPATCSLPQPSPLCRASPGLTRRRGPQTSSSLLTIVPTPISLRRI